MHAQASLPTAADMWVRNVIRPTAQFSYSSPLLTWGTLACFGTAFPKFGEIQKISKIAKPVPMEVGGAVEANPRVCARLEMVGKIVASLLGHFGLIS